MASRGTLRTLLLQYLATSADDAAFNPTVLNELLQQGYDSLVSDIHIQEPSYLSKTVMLTPFSATSHEYRFASQSPAITDFAHWVVVRLESDEGLDLDWCRHDELRDQGSDFFTIIGPDDSAVLHTSPDTIVGEEIFLRYGYWPTAFAADGDTPAAIPTRYHEVVALEAAYIAFGLGGEQRISPELLSRWNDRRAQLMHHVSRRGIRPSRTRIVPSVLDI